MVDAPCGRNVQIFNFKVCIIQQAPARELLEQAIQLNFSASKNEVEYEAILVGLDLALTMTMTKLEICNDSQLIIEQIQKEYEAKDECMTRYLTLSEDCLKKLDE